MARAAATEVTDRWKGFTRTLGLQYLNGDFEIAKQQHSTSLLYAEGLLTRKKANDLYFPHSGYSLLYGLRLAAESVLSDTSFAQARAEAKWLQQVGEDGRVILRGALGGMVVDDFDALPPELRFFAGGDRSIRGFDYQQIGDVNAAGEVIGGEYQAVASAEYEHYFLPKWGAAVFVDAGDAFTQRLRRQRRRRHRLALEIAGRAGAAGHRAAAGVGLRQLLAHSSRHRAGPVKRPVKSIAKWSALALGALLILVLGSHRMEPEHAVRRTLGRAHRRRRARRQARARQHRRNACRSTHGHRPSLQRP